jgi:hypothetical protein
METLDSQEALKTVSAVDVEWTETNGRVSAAQLHFKPPLAHLYAYLLASNFRVPQRIPT